MSSDSSEFFFATCQVGAERALKAEVARRRPNWRSSYSRPGFVTFKADAEDASLPRLIFARAATRSLGSVRGDALSALAAEAAERCAGLSASCLHVWERDRAAPGVHGFEPRPSELAARAGEALQAAWGAAPPRRAAVRGETVLDCVLVGPDEWWLGLHEAGDYATRIAGGLDDLKPPRDLASRAGLKMEQMLRWSGLPIRPGDRIAELGCSPGGAAQVLLGRGLRVLGVDPAEPHPSVLESPHFRLMQKRAHEVRKRDFRNMKWLACDVNGTPEYVLSAVEKIVTHPTNRMRGLLITVKLRDWSQAEHAAEYVARVRSWGFARTRAAQLQYHRREFCIAALRSSRKSKRRDAAA